MKYGGVKSLMTNYGELLQYLICGIPTDDSFCFILFSVFFALFFCRGAQHQAIKT